ncbi:DNA-binding transcriptional regulator, XRE-family HTH domain [Spirosomataceae bacterium TFI 002]|nr:DNA-binding transcriptional regulator, XRE-family HTH domain [Spirosomataceae bacterium TFI 002]
MFSDRVKIKDVKLEIGGLVRSLRKKNKLSQQDLADLLGLSRLTIQNLESGKNFTIDTLLKVLQNFEMLPNLQDLILSQRKENEETINLY